MSADIITVGRAHSIADRGQNILLQWVVDDLLRHQADAQLHSPAPASAILKCSATFGLMTWRVFRQREPTVARFSSSCASPRPAKGSFSV